MYKSLEKFLEKNASVDALVNYDFKNECPDKSVMEEKTAIGRFLAYKKYKVFDCDDSNGSCPLMGDIYEKLWEWRFKKRFDVPEFIKKNIDTPWTRYGADTMNSFKAIYNQAVKFSQSNGENVNNIYLLNRFATLTHTIGNFTLVPFHLNESDEMSFNQYRGYDSGKYFVHDFFDLSLKLIKENVSDSTFRQYIDTFYLKMYVDEQYNVRPLFKRHEPLLKQEKMDLSNPDSFLPANMSEVMECLQNISRNIEERGYLLASTILEVKHEPLDAPKKDEADEKKIDGSKEKTIILRDEYNQKMKKNRRNISLTLLLASLCFSTYLKLKDFDLSFEAIMSFAAEYGFMATLKGLWLEFATFRFIGDLILLSLLMFIMLEIALIFILAIVDSTLKYWYAQCPNCGKLHSYSKTNFEKIKEQSISIKVINQDKDKEGNIRGTIEQYIPGTRYTYRNTHQCSHCDYIKQREFSKDEKHI